MTKTLPIQIPIKLPAAILSQRRQVRKYETNRHLKNLSVWLILKAITTTGKIQNWNKQREDLLSVCKLSHSVFRTRLKDLKEMGLIKYDRFNITLSSWEDLGDFYGIDITNEKITYQYDYTTTQRVQEWIIAADIEHNQSKQAFAVIGKVYKNSSLKVSVTSAMLKAGADKKRIHNPNYFLQQLRVLYQSDFQEETDLHDELIKLRPDSNRSVSGISNAWAAKNKTTVSYWKNNLVKCGIAAVQKMEIISKDRVRNPFCSVKWLKKDKQTMLRLCDDIVILKPWLASKDFTDLNTTNTNNENIFSE